jgi:hypothetical protein
MTQFGKYFSMANIQCTSAQWHHNRSFSPCAATVTAVYATSFTMDFPFDPQELIVFALIG